MQTTQDSFKLKGSQFTLTILQLLDTDLSTISTQLEELHNNTPNFFQDTPVVIDISLLKPNASLDFEALKQQLNQFNLIPVGVRGGTSAQTQEASACGFAIMPEDKSSAQMQNKTPSTIQSKVPPLRRSYAKMTYKRHPSMLVTKPVRSGQQVYAKETDLIVLAPVSHGAELLSDGHIHVYGTLHGRALAGINGDSEARIFCKSLDAEMVSIAGKYKLNDETKSLSTEKETTIYLEDEQLCFGTY